MLLSIRLLSWIGCPTDATNAQHIIFIRIKLLVMVNIQSLRVLVIGLLFFSFVFSAQAQDPSAIMDLESTTQGALVPRMTTAEREAIVTPAQSLLVYDMDTGSFWYYEDMVWNEIEHSKGPMLIADELSVVGLPTIDNDPAGVVDTIVLVDTGMVTAATEIKICIDITHPFDDALDIVLIAPDGFTTIQLSTDNGGSGANYTNTCFLDGAQISIVDGAAPFTGTFRPEDVLSNLIGQTMAGNWILNVIDDDAFGDVGTFNSWSIEINEVESQLENELSDADADTKVFVEKSADEDVIRFEVAGHEFLQLGDSMATFDGNVTADTFYGDGSKLTGIVTGGGGSSCNIYGDGSAGNLTIIANTNWSTDPPLNGNYMFNNLTINAGVTLSVVSGSKILVAGTFTNNGTLLVLPGVPGERPSVHPEGRLAVVKGHTLSNFIAYQEDQLRIFFNPFSLAGTSGGDGSSANADSEGGSGGGVLIIRAANSIVNEGIIDASGGDGVLNLVVGSDASGCGGGGGGFVYLISDDITNNGTIDVHGGNGGNPGSMSGDHAGGGGGAGLIHLISSNASSVIGTLNITGGLPGTTPSGNTGTGQGSGGGASAGNSGLGGANNPAGGVFPPDPGETGYIFRTQVSNPCALGLN